MGVLSRLLGAGGARDPVTDLLADHRATCQQAQLLRALVERARYPQMAASLRELAAIEERQASALRDRILARGEVVPAVEPPVVAGKNQWERAVDAFQRARQKRLRLIEQISHWEPEEVHLAEFLRQLEQEAQRAFPVYEGLIMRSDPQALD